MHLKKIYIARHYDGAAYHGSVEFENELGTIDLRLGGELSAQVIALCADHLVKISRAAAEEMTAKVITACLPAPRTTQDR